MCLHYDKQFAPTRITTINPQLDVALLATPTQARERPGFGPGAGQDGWEDLEAHLLFDYKQQRAVSREL